MAAAVTEFESFLSGIAGSIAEHIVLAAEPPGAASPSGAEEGPAPVDTETPADPYVVDAERIVWHFPDVASRLMDA